MIKLIYIVEKHNTLIAINFGAETSGGGWQVAGAGGVHVEGGRRFVSGEELGNRCKREGMWQQTLLVGGGWGGGGGRIEGRE